MPMKKTMILLLVVAGTFSFLHAQPDDWRHLEQHRKRISARGMYVLGGWAIANLVANPLLASNSSGTTEHFYEMNTAWNMVNLGLAGIALHRISQHSSVPSWQAAFKEQYFTEQLFLVNSTLNLVYISAGVYLHERSKNAGYNAEWLRGSGRSLIFQGSFLMAFDVGMYFVHHKTQKKWIRYLQTVSVGPTGVGMDIPIR